MQGGLRRWLARSLLLLSAVCAVMVIWSTPANAGSDDYPTSIDGCKLQTNPSAGTLTCNLKDTDQDMYIDPWGEYSRECTSFVAWRLHSKNRHDVPFRGGNAGDWGSKATEVGFAPNSTPAVGAIAWWAANPKIQGDIGHVAWVESVDPVSSKVTIEEYNYKYTGDYSERTIAASAPSGYIHFADLATDSTASTTTSHPTTDGARIAMPSGQQYVWVRGVTMPVGYGDAQRYDTENNPLSSGNTNWSGPTNNASLPGNTVFRPVGSGGQYLWTGSQKLPIWDAATSACLVAMLGRLVVVPADWASAQP